MPNLPNTPEYNVEGWFTDPQRDRMFCHVTIPGDPQKRVETVYITGDELVHYSAAVAGDFFLRQAISARVRDAVARLAGYHNYAHMVREAKRQARQ